MRSLKFRSGVRSRLALLGVALMLLSGAGSQVAAASEELVAPAGTVQGDAPAPILAAEALEVHCDAAPFTDVPLTHPFCADIEWMVQARISTGYQDGRFQPGSMVTRQAMAAFLYRLANPDAAAPSCGGSAPFRDVPASHPFCGEIKWMADSGISTGYNGNLFRPADAVSRQAMSAFLFRLSTGDLNAPGCGRSPFGDVTVSHPFCGAISWMASTGISTGYTDDTYRPAAPVSRQAMSAFMSRGFVSGELARSRGGVLTGVVTAADDGAPLAGAEVLAYPVYRGITNASGVSSATTDSDGRYRFDNLRTDIDGYRACFYAPIPTGTELPYEAKCSYEDVYSGPVTSLPGQLDAELAPMGVVQGTASWDFVYDVPTERSGTLVFVSEDGLTQLMTNSVFPSQNRFTSLGLPIGTYYVCWTATSYFVPWTIGVDLSGWHSFHGCHGVPARPGYPQGRFDPVAWGATPVRLGAERLNLDVTFVQPR